MILHKDHACNTEGKITFSQRGLVFTTFIHIIFYCAYHLENRNVQNIKNYIYILCGLIILCYVLKLIV